MQLRPMPLSAIPLPVAGLLLIAGAILKWLELAVTPLYESLFTARWQLAALIELELVCGIWFLSAAWPRLARTTALVLFTALAAVSLAKAVQGHDSCGCFGGLIINPWLTFAVDLALVVWLFLSPPVHVMPGQWLRLASATAVAILLLTLPVRVSAYINEPAVLQADGEIIGESESVLLQPETWLGQRLPLLRHIDVGPELAYGHWRVFLYRRDCSKCAALLAECGRNGRGALSEVAFIEVTGHPQTIPSRCKSGALSSQRRWLVRTPILLLLRDGQLSAVNSFEQRQTADEP